MHNTALVTMTVEIKAPELNDIKFIDNEDERDKALNNLEKKLTKEWNEMIKRFCNGKVDDILFLFDTDY